MRKISEGEKTREIKKCTKTTNKQTNNKKIEVYEQS